jgi:hypothetical protein
MFKVLHSLRLVGKIAGPVAKMNGLFLLVEGSTAELSINDSVLL